MSFSWQSNGSNGSTGSNIPPLNPGSPISPGTPINSGGSNSSVINGNGNFSYSTPISAGNSLGHTITTSSFVIPQKNSVSFLVIKPDGTKLQLREKSPITPKQLLGINKFLALVAMAAMGKMNNVKFNWLNIIKELDIMDHFQELTDTDADTFYIHLS
jgi:hypothetical protein